MSYDPERFLASPRVVLTARLRPLIGTRFQPTGFPNLGAAEYQLPSHEKTSRVKCLLVESPQSIANHLERTLWDDANDDVLADFQGLPYVRTVVDGASTDSIQEAHRLNSPYLIEGLKTRLMERAEIKAKLKVATGKKGTHASEGASDVDESESSSGVDTRKLASAVFYYDPNSVLHGVFLEKVVGLARLTRIVSGFIEASSVEVVQSGGVKNDRVDPSGKRFGGANKGFGNVPYSKAEYAAEVIEASFSFDSARVRAYGLPQPAQRLLLSLALWKIGSFLRDGARLRTACDLVVDEAGLTVRMPSDAAFPPISELLADVKAQIRACTSAGLFANPAITNVDFPAKAEAK